ncbi:MAG: hypothetical protein PHU27_09660 [Salinivirgaceae bacterium]|nr:hypothetical protein [Salinivirgaceae bacterium]
MDWLTNWIFDLLYGIQKTICYIIDFIKEIFYMLAGIEPVQVNGEESDLLTHFLLSDAVKKAFWLVLLIAVILLIVFVIVAIVRSEYAHGENKKSKTLIFGKACQSFLIFLLVPFILLAGITFSNTVVSSVNQSMNPYVLETGQEATIGGQILVTSGYYAYIGEASERQQIELKFITGELDYNDSEVVGQYYKIRSLDFFVGIIGGIVILVMFVMSAISFIQRIFDIILLYIVSPISVSTIPTDDGQRFKQWKEMLIGKVLGAYGIILSMNLFFIIIPQVQLIAFFGNSFKDGIVKILFLIGGAFAVTKANIVIANLTGSHSGGSETRELIANMRTGKNITRAVGATALGLGGAILGGKHFMDSNKKDGFGSGLRNTFTHASGNYVGNSANPTKASRYGKMPTRIASMPIGMMKDLASGGLVGLGKNFVPRMNNAFKGTTLFNHAQALEKKNKDNKKDQQSQS